MRMQILFSNRAGNLDTVQDTLNKLIVKGIVV